MLSKIIKFCKQYEKDLILVMVIILVALISFGLGRLSKIKENRTPITIENLLPNQNSTSTSTSGVDANVDANKVANGAVVASKNGTKYHYPWCAGAQSIKEENKIYFSSTEEARNAGYTPASNCKGLK